VVQEPPVHEVNPASNQCFPSYRPWWWGQGDYLRWWSHWKQPRDLDKTFIVKMMERLRARECGIRKMSRWILRFYDSYGLERSDLERLQPEKAFSSQPYPVEVRGASSHWVGGCVAIEKDKSAEFTHLDASISPPTEGVILCCPGETSKRIHKLIISLIPDSRTVRPPYMSKKLTQLKTSVKSSPSRS
jgi:hypothetical protein